MTFLQDISGIKSNLKVTDADAEEREHIASSVNSLMLQSKHFVIVTHAITFVVHNLKEYKLLEWPLYSESDTI